MQEFDIFTRKTAAALGEPYELPFLKREEKKIAPPPPIQQTETKKA